MDDLQKVAAFVREMMGEGAVHVRVGDVEVTFAPSLGPMAAEPSTVREPTREEIERANERLRYAHVEGM